MSAVTVPGHRAYFKLSPALASPRTQQQCTSDSLCAWVPGISADDLAVVVLQVYNDMTRAFPRRFVLPLGVTGDTPSGQNLNTRPDSPATCVKTGHDKVSTVAVAVEDKIRLHI